MANGIPTADDKRLAQKMYCDKKKYRTLPETEFAQVVIEICLMGILMRNVPMILFPVVHIAIAHL